jgi:hypothetical protein
VQGAACEGPVSVRACGVCVSKDCRGQIPPPLNPPQKVAYLVLYGDLPGRPQLALFQDAVMRHSALPT